MELKHCGRRICSAGLPTPDASDESKDLGSRPRLDPRRGGAQATANYTIIFEHFKNLLIIISLYFKVLFCFKYYFTGKL